MHASPMTLGPQLQNLIKPVFLQIEKPYKTYCFLATDGHRNVRISRERERVFGGVYRTGLILIILGASQKEWKLLRFFDSSAGG